MILNCKYGKTFALFLVAAALLTPLSSQGATFVDCGGEGESPCSLFDGVFWENGTGFCDSGLQATGFRVLDDIPAFRANAWVNINETNLDPIREIISAGLEVEATFNAFGDGDLWTFETIASAELCVPGTNQCLDAPVKAPAIAGKLVNASVSLVNLVAQVDELAEFGWSFATSGKEFRLMPTVPISPPSLPAFSVGDGPGQAGCTSNIQNECTEVAEEVCEWVPTNVCEVVQKVQCSNVSQEVCKQVKKCKDVCDWLPFGESICDEVCSWSTSCDWVTKKVCDTVDVVECGWVSKKVCETVSNTVCTPVGDVVCLAQGGADITNELVSFAGASANYTADLVSTLQDFIADFEDPPGTCENYWRHDFDAELQLTADGEVQFDGTFGEPLRGDGIGDVTEFKASWTRWALHQQRELGSAEPLNLIQHIDSHNAYNTTADGYILPNQRYSLSDQLDLGVRSLEMDANKVTGHFRACHGKGDDVGCSALDRIFDNALREIRTWLDAHPEETIIIRLEDYADDQEQALELAGLLEGRLGDIAVYEWDLPSSGLWPSIDEMRDNDQQVIVFVYHDDSMSEMTYANPLTENSFESELAANICEPGWALEDLKTFIRMSESRPLLTGLDAGTEADLDLLNEEQVASIVQCGVSLVSLDFIHAKDETPADVCFAANMSLGDCRTPDERLRMAVWSFAEGDYGQYGDAFYVDAATRRMHSDDSETPRPYACALRRVGAPGTWADPMGAEWVVTSTQGHWLDGGIACVREFGPDYEFSTPRNGWQASRLVDALTTKGEAAGAWTSLHDGANDGVPTLTTSPELSVAINGQTPAAADGLPAFAPGETVYLEAFSDEGVEVHWTYSSASAPDFGARSAVQMPLTGTVIASAVAIDENGATTRIDTELEIDPTYDPTALSSKAALLSR